jgi:phosphoglucomutase
MNKDEITREFSHIGCRFINGQGGTWATDHFGMVFAWLGEKTENWKFCRKGRFRVKGISI